VGSQGNRRRSTRNHFGRDAQESRPNIGRLCFDSKGTFGFSDRCSFLFYFCAFPAVIVPLSVSISDTSFPPLTTTVLKFDAVPPLGVTCQVPVQFELSVFRRFPGQSVTYATRLPSAIDITGHNRTSSDIAPAPGACVDVYCWSGLKSKDYPVGRSNVAAYDSDRIDRITVVYRHYAHPPQ
jgi:hypothetical protein